MDRLYGSSLNLEKLFTRSSCHDIVCFSILASGPHLDATITLENIFKSSSTDAIILYCGPLIMYGSLVLEDFFGSSRISPVIKGLNSLNCGLLSDGPPKETFQKVQCEVIT